MLPSTDAPAQFLPSEELPEQALRALVLSLKRRHPRGRLPTMLCCGALDNTAARLLLSPATSGDHAIAADIVTALLDQAAARAEDLPPEQQPHRLWCWLERSGGVDRTPEDAAWEAAVRRAGEELGCNVRFVVVTRHGWHEREGSRSWRRLRVRRPLAPAA